MANFVYPACHLHTFYFRIAFNQPPPLPPPYNETEGGVTWRARQQALSKYMPGYITPTHTHTRSPYPSAVYLSLYGCAGVVSFVTHPSSECTVSTNAEAGCKNGT